MAAPATAINRLDLFASDVRAGLLKPQKELSSKYFYDALGSALFEAICLLPEYGLTRADERVLSRHANEIVSLAFHRSLYQELQEASFQILEMPFHDLRSHERILVGRSAARRLGEEHDG